MLWNHTEPEHDDGEEETRDNTQNSPDMVMHFQNKDDQRGQARDAAKIREDHFCRPSIVCFLRSEVHDTTQGYNIL